MLGLFGRKKTPPPLTVDPATPITQARYVVLDTELTGLDESRDSIVSVGALTMEGGSIKLGSAFYQLASPRTKLTAKSVVIHEITPSEVKEKPQIDAVLKDLIEYCADAIIVGHFISIDLAFLNREMHRMYRHDLANPAIDTFSIYQWLKPRMRGVEGFSKTPVGHRLFEIAPCFDVPVGGAHNAAMDAFATAQLFQRFIPLLTEAGVRDISDLLRIGPPFKGGEVFGLTNEFMNF